MLWVLSGPGTQNPNVPIKDTDVAYKDKPWAYGMDRQRGNYAARLLRTIAEVKSGQSPTYGPLNHVYEQKEQTRRMIEAFAPPVFYNGTEMENEGVAWALTQSGVIVPRDSITVSGQGIKKTVDQVKDFKVPESVEAAGREIGIVSHAPHLVRAVHMINRYRPLPDDTRIRLYPLPTPSNGRQEYAEMELRGLLYYTFLSPDRDTTPEAYPYKIF